MSVITITQAKPAFTDRPKARKNGPFTPLPAHEMDSATLLQGLKAQLDTPFQGLSAKKKSKWRSDLNDLVTNLAEILKDNPTAKNVGRIHQAIGAMGSQAHIVLDRLAQQGFPVRKPAQD